jgi:hypothetical protein
MNLININFRYPSSEFFICLNKSHGGFFDKTVFGPGNQNYTGLGISKDNKKSPHGELHLVAAKLSTTATVDMLRDFWGIISFKTSHKIFYLTIEYFIFKA